MGVQGIELRTILPRSDEVSHVQRRGDEGSAQERFAAQLNQELYEKRQGVGEAPKTEGERIDNTRPRQGSPKEQQKKKGRRRHHRQEVCSQDGARGHRLDVRA
ncbi:MAG: hypothetical protein GX062_09110 [Firmicutes bacterium]|nr:hypothetical protein [Bacillota bacterium]